MIGVEHDLDLVVVVNIFPSRHPGAYFPGIVETDEDYIEILLVVAEVGFGGLGNGFAVVRIALGESAHLRHLQGDFPLRLHAGEIFERRGPLQAWNRERRRPDLRGRC